MSKSSLEAAAEAAAKVNAMLIAKGKLKLTPSHLKPKIGNSLLGRLKTSTDLITAEVDINDAPVSARNLLTRGHVQDEICKASGASISTRGRYLTLEERKNSDCRPLYLNVQASVHEAVRIAVARIQEILDQHVIANGGVKNPTVGLVTYTMSSNNGNSAPNFSANPLPSGAHFIQDKVFVGLEQAPGNYPVREKIFGPGGSFLQHIRTETGATVTLRGKGSGFIEPISGREAFEPLYIHITHPKSEGLQAAKSLAINLVETAHVEFVQWQQASQPIIQPLTSVVIPQPPPVAYQSQVLVTPAVLPNALAPGSSIVATGVQTPAVSVADGTLTASIPSLIQASSVSLPGLPVSASGVQSIPVSMQGLPSQAVLTYPTYVANQNTIITRPTVPVIDRAAVPAVTMFSVLPTLPVSAAYSVATSQHAIVSTQSLPVNQYQPSIQPIAYSQPLAYAGVPVSQAHFAQSVIPHATVVVTPTTITYAVSSQFVPSVSSGMRTSFPPVAPPMVIPSTIATAYPHIHYPRFEFEHRKHKYFTNQEITQRRYNQPIQSLQESNSNHHTDSRNEQPRSMLRRPDKDLMPPPALPIRIEDSRGNKEQRSSRSFNEPEKKRLKGALDGIASIYGSDDSSDEESSEASTSKWSKT